MDLRQRIWNLMGEERRLAAAKTFWESSEQKGAQRQVEQVLAQRLHARPVFLKKLPAEKKAGYLARDMATMPYLWDAVMVSYHFAAHRQMLKDFLDALGIPNDNGHYDTGKNQLQPPTAEALEAAVKTLLEKYDRTDVLVYLGAAVTQDEQFWANLKPIVDRMTEETAAA
jgi:hypothetical protein